MKVMLVGATGFIGRHLARALVAAGHEVTGCARRRAEAFRRYPDLPWMVGDFAADRAITDWKPRVAGFDCVINAAGILRESAELRGGAFRRSARAVPGLRRTRRAKSDTHLRAGLRRGFGSSV